MTQRRRPRILGDARGTWVMPDWLRPYEEFFVDTGGLAIEDVMNRDAREANVVINAPVALICCAVRAQVELLNGMRKAGVLPPVKRLPLGPPPR